MKVRCIKATDPANPNNSETVKRILQVGDDHLLPKVGEVYEVIGHAKWDEYEFPDGTKGPAEAYVIDIEDSSHYGAKLVFSKKNFEVFDDTFVPNHFDKEMGLCRKETMFVSLKYDMPKDENGNDPIGGSWVFKREQ